MSSLNLGDGSWDDARGLVRQLLEDHQALLRGNGKDGVVKTLDNFITEYRTDRKAEKDFRDKRDAEIKAALEISNAKITQSITRKSFLWTAAGTLIALAALCVAVLSVWGMFYLARHSEVEPLKLFAQPAQRNVSYESTIPPL